MKDDVGFEAGACEIADAANAQLLKLGYDRLGEFLGRLAELRRAFATLDEIGDPATRNAVRRQMAQIAAFEPSVTLIGQVKSGKTSLLNAMSGRPDLLPADVNPWTSVVTSLHLDPDAPRPANAARFCFFDEDEWQKLLDKGGRIGALAQRAGAEEELERIRAQVEAMREKSKARLGKRFELLLGQAHDYEGFDAELVERYVCLGDYFGPQDAESEASHQGRFADITRSADLYLQRKELPLKLCLRDTPGVNDTFMMREQITIRAIRDSRICVVVLSAHQALTTVDMALIRLIANIQSREVVIFVNRIDELSDPGSQIPEIRDSIRETLRDNEGPVDAQIVFGSAYWAQHALSGRLGTMAPESTEALLNWAEASLPPDAPDMEPLDLVFRLSGLPELHAALSQRIAEGPGRELIDRAARAAANLARGLQEVNQPLDLGPGAMREVAMPRDAVEAAFDAISRDARASLQTRLDAVIEGYHLRLDRSHRSFLERACAALVAHLEKNGADAVWSYDPAGLRMLLRTGYQVFGARTQRAAATTYDEAAARIGTLYQAAFRRERPLAIQSPPAPVIAPPVVIGQTIALDIKGTWWRKWWGRWRGYKAHAEGFHDMIKAETDPLVNDLKTGQVAPVLQEVEQLLETFLAEQRDLLLGVYDRSKAGVVEPARFKGQTVAGRLAALSKTIASLSREAA